MKQKALIEQTAYHGYAANGKPIPKRGSLLPQERINQTATAPVSPQRTQSRNAGVYDPYTHTRTRNRYKTPPDQVWYEEEEEKQPVYQTKTPRSAVVYRRPCTHVEPVTRTDDLPDERQRNAPHPMVYLGVSMLIIIVFIAGYIYIPPAYQKWQDDRTYGYPRTYQTDADVGHGGESHFIVINWHGTIEVIELPTDPRKNRSQLYIIVRFANKGGDLVPATVTFTNLGDGRPDMVVTVYNGQNPTMYLLYNDGTTFKPHL